MSAEIVPRCEHASQLKAVDGQRVQLVGTYLPVPTLKKMPRPHKPRLEADLGEVVIELKGSASAYDPTAAEAAPARIALDTGFRPEEEIARLRGHRVAVEGRLVLAPDGDSTRLGATIKPAPVLHDPTHLHLAE